MTLPLLRVPDRVDCTIIARLNRFVIEVQVGDRRCRASTDNTGRLLDFVVPGRKAYCVPHARPMKTDYSLFAIEDSGAGALLDTQLQMRSFEEALSAGRIPWLEGYRMAKRNIRLGDSVVDYLLERGDETTYLEVKSAVLRDGRYAMYPDCPSVRGRRHVREIACHARAGGKAIILFIAALPAVTALKPNRQADPELYELLVDARKSGVALKALNIIYEPENSVIWLVNPDLPVELCI